MRHAIGTVGLWLGIASCLAAHGGEEEAAKRLDARWQGIQQKRPNLGVRSLFELALEGAAVGWSPEKIAQALGMAEQMQDRDPKSRTYGNFRWYWGAEKVEDLNAVEFAMQQGVLAWMLHRDSLDAEGRERLERLIRLGVEGIRRHNVAESYTNIFLMKAWNCIAIGEAMALPALAAEGYGMLDRWLLYTRDTGIHEYLSPTYYGVDLDSLGLIARLAKQEEGRRNAAAALRLFWADIAANWFPPCLRLGGAHSRDYDYLTGHGALDSHLRMEGWLPSEKPFALSAFEELTRWTPSAALRSALTDTVPRTVVQRWGEGPGQTAVQYVGAAFSIGSAGASYGPMDKPLAVNLAGGPKMPIVSFFVDARGDPYGKTRFLTGGGHAKAQHVVPFLTSVQRGPEVLLLASADPASPGFRRFAPEPACLLAQVVLPAEAALWLGDRETKVEERADVAAGEAVFLRLKDAAVGIRFVLALGTGGEAAPVAVVNDGQKYGAMRLTATLSAAKPEARGTVALWVRAAEGLDEAGFAAFRKAFGQAAESRVEGDRVEVAVAGLAGRMRLAADVAKGERLAVEGGEPGAEAGLLAVNGFDVGRDILDKVGIVARYRRLLRDAESGGPLAAATEQVLEAEAAALIVPPFEVGAEQGASGGKFLWLPGEPGGKGGSPIARALWLVRVAEDGRYHLWARVQAPTPEDDSFFVGVRQGDAVPLPRTEWPVGVHAGWTWVELASGGQPAPIPLRKGAAVVEVYARENGARLDAFVLTANPAWQPPKGE